MKVVLSIAGSDSSGGAGIQADLKTMTAHKVYGMTAITALTAQNTTGVTDIMEASPDFLGEQIEACLSDIPCDAAKIGMLPSAEQVKVVHEKLTKYKVKNLVVCRLTAIFLLLNIFISSHGYFGVMVYLIGDFFVITRTVTPEFFTVPIDM